LLTELKEAFEEYRQKDEKIRISGVDMDIVNESDSSSILSGAERTRFVLKSFIFIFSSR